MKKLKLAAIIAFVSLFTFQGCKKDDISPDPLNSAAYGQLAAQMRRLWGDHMQWTYTTVDAYVHHEPEVGSDLTRLLQNQTDLGNAFVPYYGEADGSQLGALLTRHIEDAVPVLNAAMNGDQAALQTAVNTWLANADTLGDFMDQLNPANWQKSEMENMWETHIHQTITYSVDLIQNNYSQSIIDYDIAKTHMMGMMAEMISKGIAMQFPNKF